jgi:hypothetical protein
MSFEWREREREKREGLYKMSGLLNCSMGDPLAFFRANYRDC